MFKLTVVAGPLRGNSYALHEGENRIGRLSSNEICISSSKVSKSHCAVSIQGNVVTIMDLGSSNGTFVNGSLAKKREIKRGDRLSVGDCVLELSGVSAQVPSLMQKPQDPLAQVLTFPAPAVGPSPSLSAIPAMPAMPSANEGASVGQEVPKDLIEKVKFYFEKYVINFLFNLNEKQEWNTIVKGLLGILIAFTSAVSTFPLLDKCQDILLLEAKHRAQALARLMVDRNTPAILEKSETKMDVSFAERESGVLGAYILDLDAGRVMAPGRKLNQIVSDGQEGRFVGKARSYFNKVNGSEKGEAVYFSMPAWKADGSLDDTLPILEGNLLGFAEPVKILDPRVNKNVVVAMGVVFLDLNRILIDELYGFTMFLSTVILSSIMALGVYISIHRLTLRPIQHLSKELDRVLRGESQVVANPFKMKELDEFVQLVNTTIQKSSHALPGAGQVQSQGASIEDVLGSMKFAAQKAANPMMIIDGDRNVAYLNGPMEELTSMRLDGVMGQPLTTAIGDQSFLLMLTDLIEKSALASTDGVSDSLEFSGVNYEVSAYGVGASQGQARGYVISLKQAG